MNDLNKKNMMTTILKNWYVIDSILFDGDPMVLIKDNEVFKEYLALKCGMLSTLFECYMTCHINNDVDIDNVQSLRKAALIESYAAKKVATEFISSKTGKHKLRNILMSEFKTSKKDLNELTQTLITEHFFRTAMDTCFFGMVMKESHINQLNKTFKQKMLHETYNSYRNALVTLSITENAKVS